MEYPIRHQPPRLRRSELARGAQKRGCLRNAPLRLSSTEPFRQLCGEASETTLLPFVFVGKTLLIIPFGGQELAARTELYTGAELEGLCREATAAALRESAAAERVCGRHFELALSESRPALTPADVRLYQFWNEE